TGGSSDYSKLQLQKGPVATPVEAFRNTIPPELIDFSGIILQLSPWHRKKLVFAGDSITFLDQFQKYIQARHGFSYVNNAVSGSCLAKGKENVTTPEDGVVRPSLLSRIAEINALGADLIVVFIGTNDGFYSVPLGDITSTEDTTFYGALKGTIQGLQAGNPARRIAFLTPLQRGNDSSLYVSQLGYAQAIKDVAALYAVPVLDLFSTSGITYENISHYTSDNVHPNSLVGMPAIARQISNFLNQL
ncbi:hypothetical protein BWI93_16525, partial [Siphonobacter sp. BAB-5385]|uniref:SGNH/GDSL hydrolase family protein n=1 Tax=Siphonobacter sp. BAB-5385 TaxID=1864822 RepID=UPI000BCEC17C